MAGRLRPVDRGARLGAPRAWPEHRPRARRRRAADAMALARRLVELGRAARADIGHEDPSAARARAARRRRLTGPARRTARARRRRAQRRATSICSAARPADSSTRRVKAQLPQPRQAVRQAHPVVANAVAAADRRRRRGGAGAALRADGTVTIQVEGVTSRSSWTTSSSPRRRARAGRWPPTAGETVALDLDPRPTNCAAPAWHGMSSGWSRTRASPAACEVTDRIALWWSADGPTARGADRARQLGGRRSARHRRRHRRANRPTALEAYENADLGFGFWLRRA